jgi:competence protein ComGC
MGTLGLTLWFRIDPRRRMIFRLQIFALLILWDYFKACCYFVIAADRLYNATELLALTTEVDSTFCNGWGYVISVCAFNSDCMMLLLTVHNALMIFCPRLSKTYRRKVVSFKTIFKNIREVFLFRRTPTFFNIIFDENTKTIYINEGGVFRIRWLLFATIYSTSLIISGIIFVDGGHYTTDISCTIPIRPLWKRLVNSWILKYTNLISIVIIYTSIIIYFFIRFRQLKKEKEKVYESSKAFNQTLSNDQSNLYQLDDNLQKDLMDLATSANENSTEKRLRIAMRELKTFAVYPLGYCFIWITPAISQIYVYLGYRSPFTLRLVRVITVSSSCAVITLIFLIREKPWNSTTAKMQARGETFFKDRAGFLETEAPADPDALVNAPPDKSNKSYNKEETDGFSPSSNDTQGDEQKGGIPTNLMQDDDERVDSSPRSDDNSADEEIDFMEFLNRGPRSNV